MDINRLRQLTLSGDLDAAQQLLRAARRRADRGLEVHVLSLIREAIERMCIHRGPLFDVYRMVINGQDVCLKKVADRDDSVRQRAVGSSWSHRNETNIFSGRGMGWNATDGQPQRKHLEAMLCAEHDVIQHAAKQWNHPGAQLARWHISAPFELSTVSSREHEGTLSDGSTDASGEASTHGSGERALGELCLVMPTCQGHSLSDYPRACQRELYPRMLPSLWRALCHCQHGDLSPEDLLFDPSEQFFRILDPGVCVPGPYRDRAPDDPLGLDFESILFSTNVARYPLVKPEYLTPSTLRTPVDTDHDKWAHLRDRLPSPQPPISLSEALEHDVRDGYVFPNMHSLALNLWRCETPYPRETPSIADVIAMGIMYFEILTGQRFVEVVALDWPLWSGFWSDRGSGVRSFTDLNSQLSLLSQALASDHIRNAERCLCEDLIHWRVQSFDALWRLLKDVYSP